MQISTFVLQTIQMDTNVFISIYLDTRRSKANNKYPVKLRVFTKTPRKQKLYPTVFELTENEFKSIWLTQRPREEYKESRLKLQAIENKANETANKLNPFSFENFESKLYRKNGDGGNVFYQYEVIIKKLKANKQIGTASNYELSLKSLKNFIKYDKGREAIKIHFIEITPNWLAKYESYMINTMKRSRTTVSMYLRVLRTIFNNAINDKEIESEIYPFGKRKYQLPAQKNVKKSLSKSELKILFDAQPRTMEQQRAKDFWFFSYNCNGMNIKDIALLRFENIQQEKIIFYRAKTINTGKTDLRPVTIYLNSFAKSIIEKYGNKNKKPKALVFPIISDEEDEIMNFKKIKNFTRFVNQNIKALSIAEGMTAEISTYWARHSFTTTAIRNGASMEFVSEALNHRDMKTTQGYFGGFEDESKKEIMDKLMNF